jgi:hypothetical protein
MESTVGSLIASKGINSRIFSTIRFGDKGSWIPYNHMVDRQCVGRSFSFANYEPASRQFRIRAELDNQIVASSMVDVDAMWDGTYVVQQRELPAWEIYQPSSNWTTLAIRPLAAGDLNGRLNHSQ